MEDWIYEAVPKLGENKRSLRPKMAVPGDGPRKPLGKWRGTEIPGQRQGKWRQNLATDQIQGLKGRENL